MSNPQQGSQYGQGSPKDKDNPGSGQQPQHQQQQQNPQKPGQQGSTSGQQGGGNMPRHGETGQNK